MNPSTSLAQVCFVVALVLIVAVLAWKIWKHPPDWFTSWLETRDERAIAMRTADEARARRDMEEALAMANAEANAEVDVWRNKGVM